MNVDAAKLTAFLAKASMPHADGTSNMSLQPDGSRTITVTEGDWFFHDNFFGGEPYGGRAVISYQNKPLWMMVYYGQVTDKRLGTNAIYDFLRLALQHAPDDKPFRGPDSFSQGKLSYTNNLTGDIVSFNGKETISINDKQLFWTAYVGGLIDQDPQADF